MFLRWRSFLSLMPFFEIKTLGIDPEEVAAEVERRVARTSFPVLRVSEFQPERPVDSLTALEHHADLRDKRRITSHRPLLRPFLVKGRQLLHEEVHLAMDSMVAQQREFNRQVVKALKEIHARLGGHKGETNPEPVSVGAETRIRILYRQPIGFGDVLLSTPVLRALRQKYPDALIDYMTTEPCKELLEGNPNVDRILSWEETPDISGYAQVLQPYLRTQKMRSWNTLGLHMIDLYAMLCGVKLKDYRMDIVPQKVDLAGLGIVPPFVCFQTKSSSPIKDWPRESFAQLIASVHDRYQIVHVGGDGDPEYQGCINLNGALSLRETAYVISRAQFFVGVDSIGLHLANALGVPAVGLYGATNPEIQKPLSSSMFMALEPSFRNGCSEACHGGICTQQANCITNITVGHVQQAIEGVERSLR